MTPPWKLHPISFEAFMDYCLYHPERGYYRRGRPVFGPGGDFFTSPYTHRLFAQILARAIAAYLKEWETAAPLDLVELGAGEGRLASDLLEWLGRNRPSLARQLCYRPIEVGADLPEGIRGVVFSNEFFDALPVHRVRVREGRLREIHVREQEGAICEVELEPTRNAIDPYMQQAFPTWTEGYAYEVNLRMLEVVDRLDRSLSEGIVISFDYGYVWEEYDAQPRPQGTLMCYRRHQVSPDPYRHIGEQDITAHVNFDMLREAGRRLGWQDEPLITQREFLLRWGLERQLFLEESEGLFRSDRQRERLGLKQLLLPGGISDTVKVLVQRVRRAPRK